MHANRILKSTSWKITDQCTAESNSVVKQLNLRPPSWIIRSRFDLTIPVGPSRLKHTARNDARQRERKLLMQLLMYQC